MRLHLTDTSKIVHMDGVSVRLWKGVTGTGIPVTCFIARIAADSVNDCSELEKELISCDPPEFIGDLVTSFLEGRVISKPENGADTTNQL